MQFDDYKQTEPNSRPQLAPEVGRKHSWDNARERRNYAGSGECRS